MKKPFLDEKGLVNILNGIDFLTDSGSNGIDPDRPA
jgi:hypothetical protein